MAKDNGEFTDSEMLNWLDIQTGQYTGKVIFRISQRGRGWRLHETSREGAVKSVREAITNAMIAERAKRFDK